MRVTRSPAGARVHAGSPARSPRGGAVGARTAASSLDRFATEVRHLARTEVREVEEPFGRARRARRRCRTSATRSRRNESAASRASCGRTRWSASRTWHSARAGHFPFVCRARRVAGLLPRRRLHARPVCVARRRSRRTGGADAREPRREPRPLLQPALAPRPDRLRPCSRRGIPARATPCNARVGRRARARRAGAQAMRKSRVASISEAVFDLTAYTRHVETVFERLRALVAVREEGLRV